MPEPARTTHTRWCIVRPAMEARMKSNAIFAGTFALSVAALLALPPLASADDKTVIKESPGGYSEVRKGEDGSVMKYEENGVKSEKVYKGADGTVIKEQDNGSTSKQVYQDKGCEQKTVDNYAEGESKTVAQGDCAR
jgi:hypothetical protein